MPAEKDVQTVIAQVKKLLSDAGPGGVTLELSGSRFDDGWLYLVVAPTRKGERASQHAHRMTEIERALRADGYNQVLLIPAVPEHDGLTGVPKVAGELSAG